MNERYNTLLRLWAFLFSWTKLFRRRKPLLVIRIPQTYTMSELEQARSKLEKILNDNYTVIILHERGIYKVSLEIVKATMYDNIALEELRLKVEASMSQLIPN